MLTIQAFFYKIITSKSFFDAGNKELQLVDQWLIANRLSVNVSKTKYVLFRTAQSKLTTKKQDLVLRQNKIEQVESIKFLGVYLQKHLTWSRYINYLIFELRSILGTVIKVKSLLSKRSLLLLYHSLINSQLYYCILNWCYGNKTLVKRLEPLCYKFVELVSGINSSSSVCDIMKENNFLTIDQLLTKELIVFMFRQKNGKTQLHLKISLLKTNLNTVLETNLFLFQRNVLAQYVSKLFHTVVQHIEIAFLST